MTTATDGHFAFWQESLARDDGGLQELTCLNTQALHQSSIKSLSSCLLTDGTSLIVTGGDDNSIGIAVISPSDSKENQCSTLIIPRAHAAAVTAIEILSCRRTDLGPSYFHVYAASSSNDQRIKLWAINIDLGKAGVDGVEVKRVANRHTAVADVSSIALYSNEDGSEQSGMKILICGVGMEVWDVKEK
jgi:WD40 repeat protein